MNLGVSFGGCHGCSKCTSSNINGNFKLRMLEGEQIYLGFFQLMSNKELVL